MIGVSFAMLRDPAMAINEHGKTREVKRAGKSASSLGETAFCGVLQHSNT
jgi:hypothetical protein